MYIGSFYYEIPTTLMELNVTSVYFVIFSFLVFLLSRPFKSILRPYILLLANCLFVYSFGLDNLLWLLLFSIIAYSFSLIINKFHNKYLLILFDLSFIISLFTFKILNTNNGIFVPLGISFYTFKIISYLTDVYNTKVKLETNIIYFLDYIMFFPCISAGPINRADSFLKEIRSKHDFEYTDISTGFLLLALGLFEKLVFCDYLGLIVNTISSNTSLTGLNVLLGVILYSFEIYLDFDSYSNIAIGIARMLGFKLEKNFNVPYLSTSIKDFWNRWHISLTTWLKDYIYIPLGGSKKGTVRKYINILIVFLFSAFWHGTSYNFIIWGLGFGVLRIVEDCLENKLNLNTTPEVIKILSTPFLIIINFSLVSILWIFFKYTNINDAFSVISRLFTYSPLDFELIGLTNNQVLWLYVVLGTVVLTDIFRYFFNLSEFIGKRIFIIRYALYVVLILVFLVFGVYGGSFEASDFIYRWF